MGGQQTRRDPMWDWIWLSSGDPTVKRLPNTMLQRKANGRRIDLTELLAAGTEGALPFEIPASAIFVPIP